MYQDVIRHKLTNHDTVRGHSLLIHSYRIHESRVTSLFTQRMPSHFFGRANGDESARRSNGKEPPLPAATAPPSLLLYAVAKDKDAVGCARGKQRLSLQASYTERLSLQASYTERLSLQASYTASTACPTSRPTPPSGGGSRVFQLVRHLRQRGIQGFWFSWIPRGLICY